MQNYLNGNYGSLRVQLPDNLVSRNQFIEVKLILFSGPKRPVTSLQDRLLALGIQAEAYDVINGSEFNLADDSIWRPLARKDTCWMLLRTCCGAALWHFFTR